MLTEEQAVKGPCPLMRKSARQETGNGVTVTTYMQERCRGRACPMWREVGTSCSDPDCRQRLLDRGERPGDTNNPACERCGKRYGLCGN